ncbi:MAG: CBS domain-containing protein [Niabella sp.]
MSKVSAILARKAQSLIAISIEATVFHALELMAEKNIGSLVVLDKEKYMGIMTERDYARKVVLENKHSTDVSVGSIMSTDLPSVSPDDTVEHCMELMSDKNIRYLPVFEGGDLKGIISISDVVTETIRQQRETISHLKSYIQS